MADYFSKLEFFTDFIYVSRRRSSKGKSWDGRGGGWGVESRSDLFLFVHEPKKQSCSAVKRTKGPPPGLILKSALKEGKPYIEFCIQISEYVN